jgi:hypothetical protein
LKLLHEKIEKTLDDIGLGNYFVNRTLITQEIRARINKWDCIKLKGFCTSKTKTKTKTKTKQTS